MFFEGLPRVAVNDSGIVHIFSPVLCFGKQSYSLTALISREDWTKTRRRRNTAWDHQDVQAGLPGEAVRHQRRGRLRWAAVCVSNLQLLRKFWRWVLQYPDF